MTTPQADFSVIAGVAAIGAVSALAILYGGTQGLTVAAAGVGAIGGWLTRGASNKASTETGNVTVNAEPK